MKGFIYSIAAAAIILMSLSCNEILEDQNDLGRFSVLEVFVDKSQTNQYGQKAFCHKWKYSSTQMETWVDGNMTELKEVDNVFPYMTLDLREDWSMSAQGMKGSWLYSYNHLFIDCLGSGGSNYVYQVVDLTSSQLVVRQEEHIIGGPIAPFLFHNNPAGRHVFWRFTYIRE